MEQEPTGTGDDPLPAKAITDERELMERLREGRGLSVGELGLPAIVVFKSDVQSTSIYVDEIGNVSVSRGALPDPNIVIEGTHEALCSILQTMEPTFAAPGALRITVNKGSIQGFVMDIAEGQDMDHPLMEIFVC
ncbi:MAG TPA: hypothetical protein VMW71_04765 [Thermoplasmata archaeon]|nr:hypothetical protein [Thermoplasmata archaeon]